ncbi:glycosyltransferase [Demequina globuliformis]|uniref:glycosyltransferase n=1 Tax=Demequina globuliformis TaxID=676202 RepID=UPI0013793A8E|nr:glycosyltransferase [Demequina globuliformis]
MLPQTGHLTQDYADALVDQVVALKPDIIHIHDAFMLPTALKARDSLRAQGSAPRLVYDAHEFWRPRRDAAISMIGARDAEAKLARHTDAVIAVNKEISAGLHDSTERLTLVVPNGPSSTSIPAPGREDIRTEAGLGPNVPLLVYSGHVGEKRGVETAIEALTHLPDAHLVLVSAPSRTRARELSERIAALALKDRVHFHAYVPAASVTWYLRTADIGLHTLLRGPNHDNAIPTKIAEYATAGIPLAVSDCPAQAEFVTDHGIGEVFTAGDPESLAQAVSTILASSDASRYKASPELQRSISWESHEQNLVDAYQNVLEHQAAPPQGARTAVATISTQEATLDWAGSGFSVRTPARKPQDTVSALRLYSDLIQSSDTLVQAGVNVLDALEPDALKALQLIAVNRERTLLMARAGDLLSPNTLTSIEEHADVHHWSTKRRREWSERSDRLTAVINGHRIVPLVRDPELVDHVAQSAWLPLPAAQEKFDSGAPLRADGETLRVYIAADHLAPIWRESLEALTSQAAQHAAFTLVEDVSVAHAVVGDCANGTYRQTEVDAMARGQIVIGHLRNETRAALPGDVPLIETRMATLTEDIDRIAREVWISTVERQRASHQYALNWHSAEAVQALLRDVLTAHH